MKNILGSYSDGELQPAGFDYAEIVVVRHGETEFNATAKIQVYINYTKVYLLYMFRLLFSFVSILDLW